MGRGGGGTANPANVLNAILLSGNTTSAAAGSYLISSGTVTLAGGANITLSQAGNAITIVGGAGGGGGGAFSAGVSTGGNTSGNTGTVSNQIVLAGGNNVTLSQSTAAGGATVTVSAANQTTQTQNVHNVTLSGNTAGAMAQVSSGTLTLAGGNNITLSQAGNAVTISGPNTSAQQTGISGLAGSNTTYTSGTVTITGVGGGVTVSSNTGQRIDISVAAPVAQTVQTQNLHNVTLTGNTAGVMAQISSGTMSLAGGNNITLSQNANAVTISGANQTTQTQGILSAGVSTGGNTAGNTTVNTGSRLVFVASGNLTASQGTAAGASTITLSVAAQTVQTQNVVVPSGSNTTYTSGTVVFSGSNAVTVRSTTGQAIIIDAPVQTVQTQNLHNVTLSGNTAGVMAQISSGTWTLAGGNNITLSQNGNAVTISGAAAGGAQTAISGIAASDTVYTSGTVTFTGVGGGVTISSNTGQRVDISVAAPVAQTVQTQGILSAGVSTGGNTAGNTTVNTGSRLVFVGSGNITASQGTAAGASTITLSVATQTVQTQNVVVPSGSNTTYTSGTVVFSGSNAVTVRSTTGQAIIIDAPVQTVQTQNVHNVTLSGNTAGVMAHISSGTMTLAGGNNITLSQNGNAVTISGAAGGGAGFSAGVSTGGNTAGATGMSGTQLVLVGTNNITLSQTTGANGLTISISGAGGGAGQFSAGVSTGGNSSGSTGLTGTQMVLAGGNNITLSQSTGANGGTVTISGAASWSVPSFSYWDNARAAGTAVSQLTSGGTAHRTWHFFPLGAMNDVFPGNMTVSTMRINMSGSQAATTSTLAFTLSLLGGLYTLNGSRLSLLNSFTWTYGTNAANASISTGLQGHRWISVHSSQWSAQPSLSQTNYWMAIAFSSAGEAKGISSMVFRGPTLGSNIRSGEMGSSFTTGSSTMLHQAWAGMYTATSASPPASVSKGQIAIPNATISAGAIPHIVFDNLGILQ